MKKKKKLTKWVVPGGGGRRDELNPSFLVGLSVPDHVKLYSVYVFVLLSCNLFDFMTPPPNSKFFVCTTKIIYYAHVGIRAVCVFMRTL